MSVKLIFHDETVVARRLTLPACGAFAALRELCTTQLKCPHAFLAYVDRDRDAVCVESDAELVEARRCAAASEGSVRLHVAAAREAAAASALKWERKHAAKEADAAAAIRVPPPSFPPHEAALPPPPLPPPHDAAPFVPLPFFRSMLRHGQAVASRCCPPSPPPRCAPGPELPADLQRRADEAAEAVLARDRLEPDVFAAVRDYAEARKAGAEPRVSGVARRRAFVTLHRAGLAAMGRGDNATARWLVEAATALAPRHAAARYNAACARALCGDRAGALAGLREAVALGWRNARHLEADADLASLRGDAEFAAIVASIRGPRACPAEPDAAAAAVQVPPALCVSRRIAAAAGQTPPSACPSEPNAAAAAAAGEVPPAVCVTRRIAAAAAGQTTPSECPPEPGVVEAATAAGQAPAAVCVTRRIAAAAALGAMGFSDAEAVEAALAACGDSVDEAVALLLAGRP